MKFHVHHTLVILLIVFSLGNTLEEGEVTEAEATQDISTTPFVIHEYDTFDMLDEYTFTDKIKESDLLRHQQGNKKKKRCKKQNNHDCSDDEFEVEDILETESISEKSHHHKKKRLKNSNGSRSSKKSRSKKTSKSDTSSSSTDTDTDIDIDIDIDTDQSGVEQLPRIAECRDVCDQACCEMVRFQKANKVDNIDDTDWKPYEKGELEIVDFSQGSEDKTAPLKSYKHVNRATVTDGPSTTIQSRCMYPGEAYKVKVMIKLENSEDGKSYACSSNNFLSPKVCPSFSMKYIDESNQPQLLDVQFPLDNIGENFTRFEAFFNIPDSFSPYKNVRIMFRGPPPSTNILFNAASIEPCNFNPEPIV